MMVGCFFEMCKRKGLKVNPDKIKMMVLGWEEELVCGVLVDGTRFEHV